MDCWCRHCLSWRGCKYLCIWMRNCFFLKVVCVRVFKKGGMDRWNLCVGMSVESWVTERSGMSRKLLELWGKEGCCWMWDRSSRTYAPGSISEDVCVVYCIRNPFLFGYRTSKSSEGDCRGWKVPYIIGKLLKCKCLKWPYMTHSDIWNTSYGQKKGQKSNWQFDFWPQKVKNRPDFVACKCHVTYRWKALDEAYNFALNLISIKGMHTKLWGPKVTGI
jgi:hypothetical protein